MVVDGPAIHDDDDARGRNLSIHVQGALRGRRCPPGRRARLRETEPIPSLITTSLPSSLRASLMAEIRPGFKTATRTADATQALRACDCGCALDCGVIDVALAVLPRRPGAAQLRGGLALVQDDYGRSIDPLLEDPVSVRAVRRCVGAVRRPLRRAAAGATRRHAVLLHHRLYQVVGRGAPPLGREVGARFAAGDPGHDDVRGVGAPPVDRIGDAAGRRREPKERGRREEREEHVCRRRKLLMRRASQVSESAENK